MAVAIAKQTTPAATAGSGNTVTFNTAPIGTASNDRMVVVAPTSEDSTAGAVTKVTLNGVALAKITSDQFNSMNASLWWGNFGTGTTATIVVTYTGTAPADTANRISIFAVTGADVGLSTFASDTSNDMDATSPLSLATTVPVSGGIIGVACGATSSTAAKAWGGNITEAEEVGTTAYCHTSATGTTSGATTITVTGGTNGEDGVLSIAVFRTTSGIPQFRQTSWPNPIPARRPVEFLDWFNPGLGIRSIIPDDSTNLPSVVSDWGPPPPAAPRSNVLNTWINSGIKAVVQDPFSETDWPNPKGFATRNGTWINPGIRDVVTDPFRQKDWVNPKGHVPRSGYIFSTPQGIHDTNVYLPSVALDWYTPPAKPQTLSYILPRNLPLSTALVQAPFNKTDWVNPKGFAPRDGTWITPSRDLAPPFVPTNWTNPKGFVTRDGTWINSPELPLNTVAAPFRQLDWPNPRAAKRATDLLTWINGLPPIQHVFRQPLVTRYNAQSWHVALSSQPRANLLPLITPVFAPFTPVNWTNPRGRQPQTGGHLNSALPRFEDTNTYLPSSALDWYTPPAKPQTISFISPGGLPLNTVVVTLPFRQTDWPNPRAAQRSTDLTWLSSPHVLQRPNTKPFDQSSWPVPTPRAPQPLSYTLPGGLPLNTVVVPAPFAQYNWPNPRTAPRPVDLSWLSSPHVLQRPNIQPFAKSDWTVPAGRAPLPQSFTISYSLPLNTPEGPKPFTQLDWPNPNGPAFSIILRTLIGQSQILSIPPETEPPPDFPPHEPPTDSGGAGIKSGVWKPGKRANYRSYRYLTDKEIEQLTGTEIRQSARDLRADVRKDPFAEEVQKEILALSRIVNQLADIDRLEASVAELSRAIEYARKAREEADEDEEISFLLLS